MPNYYGPWGTPNSTYRVWTAVSQSQSTANNQTTVTAVAYFEDRYGYGITDSNTLLRITIRGSKRGGDRTIKLSGGANTSMNIGTGTHTINHGSDGKLSNTGVSVHVNTRNTGLYSGTASGTLTHPTIPRATTPSSGNFTTGSATTISLPRASSSFTHNVTYKVGATTGTISSSAGASVSWTPPHSLANRFATNSTSTTVTITVQTKSGSTVIGTKTMNKTITLGASVKPNVNSLTISEQNSLVTAAGVTGAYIQNVSKIRVVNNVDNWTTINSTQKSSTFSIGTLSANSGSEIIPATSGSSVAISSTVTDQRNRIGTRSQNINILAYSNPTYTTASRVYRSKTASGVEDSDGTYLRLVLNATARSIITSSTQRNKLFIAIRTRVNGGSWQTRTAPSPTSNTYNSTYNIPATHVTSKSHEVEVTLTDNFGGKTVVVFNVGTSVPTMDLNGFAVGIGKMHEQGALDVGGDIHSSGDYFGGLGRIYITDWDTATTPGGFYTANAGANNAPTSGSAYQGFVMTNQGATRIHQIVIPMSIGSDQGTIYVRYRGATDWYDWKAHHPNDTLLLGTTNLNTVTKTGMYIQTANVEATTARNYPHGVAGFLEVVSNKDASGTGVGILQRYTEYNQGGYRVWMRRWYSSWGAWGMISNEKALEHIVHPASTIAVSSGWTVNERRIIQRGNVVQVYLSANKTAAVNSHAQGNIANQTMANINNPSLRPGIHSPMISGPAGKMFAGYVNSGGNMILTATVWGNGIGAGEEVSVTAVWSL